MAKPCKIAHDQAGRELPAMGIGDLSTAEENALITLCNWRRAKKNRNLANRLYAWDFIAMCAHFFAEGPEAREYQIKENPLTPEEAAAIDGIVKMWDARTKRNRQHDKARKRREKAEKKAAKQAPKKEDTGNV